MVRQHRERFGTLPPKDVLSEYFMLFTTAEEAEQNTCFHQKMALGQGFRESKAYMQSHGPMFDSYEQFLSACSDEESV